MNLYLFRDYVGLYTPIILFILTILLLRNMTTYLFGFLYGFIANNIINIILKLLIKEPRPTTDQKAIEIAVVNGARISFDKFGMPSGHGQNCGFCITFITMVLANPYITGLYVLLSITSLLQRYFYNNHTMLQLCVGVFIGCIIGYVSYVISYKYITGNIQTKVDDFAPI